MGKKAVVILLVLFCLWGFSTGIANSAEKAPDFRDIKGSFAEQSIISLTRQGIIRGINATQFAPQKNITRLQFTVLMAKALGVQPFFPAAANFYDIPSGSAAAGYVEAVANLGLIRGTGLNAFSGESPIRRQDVAVIIHKAMVEQNLVLTGANYTDAGQISPYAVDSVAFVSQNGWMNSSRGYFYPLRRLTRAEAAVIIDRLLKIRKEQAQKAVERQLQLLQLDTAETREIGTVPALYPIAFTPVYGSDNPVVFSVSPGNAQVSGKQPGTGTLTVNAGNSSFPVTVEVNNAKDGLEPFADDVLTALRMPETVREVDYKYTVTQHFRDSVFKNTELKTHPGPVGGLFSKSDTWTGFLRQQGRDIIVDIGMLGSVSGITMEFRHDTGAGVYLPEYIKGSVSADGVSWYQLGHIYHGKDPADKNPQNVLLSLSFPSVTTRYIKLSFPVEVWVFARHLTIQGGYQVEKPAVLAPATFDTPAMGNYLQDPDLKDILLMYTGERDYPQTLTSNEFLPLVAYIDRQGEIKGRMFDTMLFLPYGIFPCARDRWESYLNNLFTPGKQLQALEETAEKVYQATGWQIKEKVILTLPYPDSAQSNFGGISFSEKDVGREKAAKNRLEAVKWYYGELMNKWNSAGFKNLELAGIYWNRETVDKNVYGEVKLVQDVARMVKGNGQRFIWIPYYGAQGYENWKSFGFTHVFLQPNYYAAQAPPEDRMDHAAELARKYGTGIEIELDLKVFSDDYYDLFYNELNKAHHLGLDGDTVNAYYIGLAGTLLDAANSGLSKYRQIYDDIFRWISGTYN